MLKIVPKGALIVLEGIDGAGKTSQCEYLERRLREKGWDVLGLREPTDGPCGRRIRELARAGRDGVSPREELDLFLQDRRENVERNVRPALRRGAIVLLDRYYYSTIAYQGARGIDPSFIRSENEKFAPPADLLIYLTIPVEMAATRIEESRKESRNLFEAEPYLRKVKALFDAMTDAQLVRVDGTADAQTVAQRIWATVRTFLERKCSAADSPAP
jgi:dTMP kinase